MHRGGAPTTKCFGISKPDKGLRGKKPARFAVDAEKTSSSTVLFFSLTECKLPSPEILRSGI